MNTEIVIVCVLLLVFIAMDYSALVSYRRLIRLIQRTADVKKDWGRLADGRTGSVEFERLWLRTAQREFERISDKTENSA